MNNTCHHCNQPFEIEQDELDFIDKISPAFAGKKYLFGLPTLCPWCRLRRRLAWRNERYLYKRKCDLSGKEIISIYPPDSPFKIYDKELWWSDKVDNMQYGRDFDFSRPFFEQFNELLLAVPRMALIGSNNENCDYASYISGCKDCYMSFVVYYASQNVHYSNWAFGCTDCIDIYLCHTSELLYECVQCKSCYNCSYCLNCTGCSDCLFSAQLKNCSNCLFSNNLVNKKFHIFNKPYSEKEYFSYLQNLDLGSHKNTGKNIETWKKMMNSMVVRDMQLVSCEDSVGENLWRCKNSKYIFDCTDSENCKYYLGSSDVINSQHGIGGQVEWTYEISNCGIGGSNYCFCSSAINCSNILYCENCYNCNDCFGCAGLKNKKFCIFNKQYSQAEYEKLAAQIIGHMKKNSSGAGQAGEYGEFYPMSMSPFAFNKSLAAQIMPLNKEEALKLGAYWRDDEKAAVTPINLKENLLADSINEIESVPADAQPCMNCGSAYRILPMELAFYKKKQLPLPRYCLNCRHEMRTQISHGYKFYDRTCAKCTGPIKTTYAPERPETVYCESCYLKEIY